MYSDFHFFKIPIKTKAIYLCMQSINMKRKSMIFFLNKGKGPWKFLGQF